MIHSSEQAAIEKEKDIVISARKRRRQQKIKLQRYLAAMFNGLFIKTIFFYWNMFYFDLIFGKNCLLMSYFNSFLVLTIG